MEEQTLKPSDIDHPLWETYFRCWSAPACTYRFGERPYIEASSAILAYTRVWPIAHTIKPQKRSAVPPSVSENPKVSTIVRNMCRLRERSGSILRQDTFPASYTSRCKAKHGDKTKISLLNQYLYDDISNGNFGRLLVGLVFYLGPPYHAGRRSFL